MHKPSTATEQGNAPVKPQWELDIESCVPQWTRLLKALKADIFDECRCSDDPDDETPGMLVTIGFTTAIDDRDFSWGYQTGDNSFTGGAYGHRHWAVISLFRRSRSAELAEQAADEIGESVASAVEYDHAQAIAAEQKDEIAISKSL